MPSVKVSIINRQNAVKIPNGIRLLIRKCCTAVLKSTDFEQPAEVSVSFLDNKQMAELNLEYRKIDLPTDVLSFPLGEDGKFDVNPQTGHLMLGDIVISVEKAFEQAEFFGHSISREIGFLTVHSMLHILGYDHEKGPLETIKMREKEEEILATLGLVRDTNYLPDEYK